MIRHATKALVALVFGMFVVASFAEEPVDAGQKAFHELVTTTYDVPPRTLDHAGLAKKSAELDNFWSAVRARGDAGLQLLRAELGRADAPLFFSYDGAKLLLSLSERKADRALALAAIARSDLRDIQASDYFFTVHALAVQGLDTTEAALKILSEPRFQVVVPQHALTLDQDKCLVFLLIPTDDAFYLQKAIDRLFAESDPTAQQSLVTLLVSTVTEAGDKAVGRFAADGTRSVAAREYASKWVQALGIVTDAPWREPKSYRKLKAAQRKALSRVSDEAIYDFEEVLHQLRGSGK